MTDGLTFTSTRVGGVAVCVVTGEVDISTVDELRTAVLADAGDAELVRLDLSGVAFIDTTGLGTLLELRSSLQAEGVGFQIMAVEGPVRQAVEITGLSDLLA